MRLSALITADPAGSVSPAPPMQEIRFCAAGDGTRLAYATVGAGRPLVKAANWLSHLAYDCGKPGLAALAGRIVERFHLIRCDERGCGLPDWDIGPFSFDDWVDDLEAVVDAAGLDRFPLLGISQGGPVAIGYAVGHPQRVTHLVLLGSFAQGRRKRASTPSELEPAEAHIEIVRLRWGRPDPMYRQIFVSRFLPEATQDQWRSFDELQRRSTFPENAWRFVDEFANIDTTTLAPKLTVPTLIMCSRREPA